MASIGTEGALVIFAAQNACSGESQVAGAGEAARLIRAGSIAGTIVCGRRAFVNVSAGNSRPSVS